MRRKDRRTWESALRSGAGPMGESRLLRAASDETLFLRKLWHSTRTRWQRLGLVAFFLWVVYAVMFSPHGWLQLIAVRRQVQELQNEVDELERRKASLDRLQQEMDWHEPFQMEKRAREDFGYARENERIYLLTPDDADDRNLTEGELSGGDRFSERRLAQ